MLKDTKTVGIIAIVTLVIVIAFVVMYFTTKERVITLADKDEAGQPIQVTKKHIFGMGLKKAVA